MGPWAQSLSQASSQTIMWLEWEYVYTTSHYSERSDTSALKVQVRTKSFGTVLSHLLLYPLTEYCSAQLTLTCPGRKKSIRAMVYMQHSWHMF